MTEKKIIVQKKKFLLVGHKTDVVVNLRGDLLCDIQKKGYDVVIVVPEDDCRDYFEKNNIKVRLINLKKSSTSVFNTVSYYNELKRIIKEENPDIVFSFTAKPVIFGSLAANKVGVKNIYSLICGLGLLFCSDDFKIKVLRTVCGKLYKRALKVNNKVIFQNRDDIDEFVRRGYVEKQKCELVNGSGVNLKKFSRNKLPKGKMSFLMVSRIVREKGVLEYFEAAKRVKEEYPEVEFVFIGANEDNRNALNLDELKPYIDTGIVNYVSETKEVEKFVADCSVFVLPSYYREGIPRTLLEATAMGRPIITTNAPGCRETVVEGANGLFVKPRDVDDLVDKMIWMINNESKLQKMGDESYKICLEKFTIDIINNRMMGIMEI